MAINGNRYQMARTEVRKECPSCGLGVPLDAKVCEFCGWDFEEEDEWISQIEQLEQELMSEKQKTDTAKVDRMIKSTLRSPIREKVAEKPIAITVKKRIPSRPEITDEEEEQPERIRISAPPATAPKKTAISIKVGAPQEEELPPPPEELESTRAPAARPSAPAALVPGKKVRRVVRSGKKPPVLVKKSAVPAAKPMATPMPEVEAKPQAPKPAAAPAAPVKPTTATPPQPAKPAEEKKGLFGGIGKMFSMQTSAAGARPAAPKQPSAKPADKVKEAQAAPAKKEPVAPEKEKAPVVTVKVFVCPLCNAEVKETEKTCPNCGAEFE